MHISSRTYTKLTLLFALSNISLQTFSDTPSIPPTKKEFAYLYSQKPPRCEVAGMVGACKDDICEIIKRLIEEEKKIQFESNSSEESKAKNLLLLEGPTGIGKTRLAEAIATNANRHFVKINAPDLLSRYIGGTAEALKAAIAHAMAEGRALKKGVVILIDEIDKLATNEKSTAHNEYNAAIAALCCHLDENQYKPEVFFVFATNCLNQLPLQFKNRMGSNIVSMKNPDSQQREELLRYFSKHHTKRELQEYCSDECIKTVVEKTEKCSVRDIDDLCFSIHKYASRENTPITEGHVMYALHAKIANIELQNAPSEEELEKLRRLKREEAQDKFQELIYTKTFFEFRQVLLETNFISPNDMGFVSASLFQRAKLPPEIEKIIHRK